jgi:hypothetical protein
VSPRRRSWRAICSNSTRTPELQRFLKLSAGEIVPGDYLGLEEEIAGMLRLSARYALDTYVPHEKRRKTGLARDDLESLLCALCGGRALAELRSVVKDGKPARETRELKRLVDVVVHDLLTIHSQKATTIATVLDCHRDTVYAMSSRGANSDKKLHREGLFMTPVEMLIVSKLESIEARMIALSKAQPDDDLFLLEMGELLDASTARRLRLVGPDELAA